MDAGVGGQHQRDDGRSEQRIAVARLRIEAHAVGGATHTMAAVGRDSVCQVRDQPVLRRTDASVQV
jgi:hypothetical protein